MSDRTIRCRDGSYIGAKIVFPTSKGASFGPRVISCGFTADLAHPTYRRGHVEVTIETDGKDWQNEQPIRRRSARIAVPFLARLATQVRSGEIKPIAEFQPRSKSWARMVWFHFETAPDGRDRSARVAFDFPADADEGEPKVRPGDADRAADGLQGLGKRLHSAIDDVVNLPVFGRVAG